MSDRTFVLRKRYANSYGEHFSFASRTITRETPQYGYTTTVLRKARTWKTEEGAERFKQRSQFGRYFTSYEVAEVVRGNKWDWSQDKLVDVDLGPRSVGPRGPIPRVIVFRSEKGWSERVEHEAPVFEEVE